MKYQDKCVIFVPLKNGVLAHLVERNTGSVEVSGSSPLCSTKKLGRRISSPFFVVTYCVISPVAPSSRLFAEGR